MSPCPWCLEPMPPAWVHECPAVPLELRDPELVAQELAVKQWNASLPPAPPDLIEATS